jgi:hypothetical protein
MFIKNTQSKFVPAPEGIHQSVLVDILEPYKSTAGKFGEKEVTRFIFEIDLLAPSGQRYTVSSQQLTLSLHEKSNMRRQIEKIIGRSLTAEELDKGFDLDALLLGKQVTIVVEHAQNADKSKTFANIALIQPVKQPFPAWKSDFIRFKNRPSNLAVPTQEEVEEELENDAKAAVIEQAKLRAAAEAEAEYEKLLAARK